MRIIFLTMSKVQGISEHRLFLDLMRKFRDEGHQVTIVAPRERRLGQPTALVEVDGVRLLGVRTLNLQKTNIVEKGIGQTLVEPQFKRAIRKYLGDAHFDIILYTTPPVMLTGVVKYLKKKNPQAISYLLLKDIFPQNAVDLGLFGKHSLFYWWFRRKEVSLYRQSDYIGCMSPANVNYLLAHNPYVDADRVEVAPNSLELQDYGDADPEARNRIRQKYGLPTDKPVFIYGGNLGKPQDIPFIIRCLDANANRSDCHFLVVGSGTEQPKLAQWYAAKKASSVTVLDWLPKEDYDLLVRSCDIGLIFLDYRFTIPNFPSRLLSYLENKMPIIAATDPNCDTGDIAEANGFGFKCRSNSVEAFTACVDRMLASDVNAMGENGYRFLCENYLVEHTYGPIISHS